MIKDFNLYKNKENIASFKLDFNITDLFATDIQINNKQLFPVQANKYHPLEDVFSEWLRLRAYEINKDLSDEEIMDFYGCVYKCNLGRMLPFVTAKAVLQYMESSNDDYYITPVHSSIIYYGYIDERFAKMFIFKPKGVNK